MAAQAIADGTPRADVTLPRHTPQRRRSSLVRNQRMAALKDLPALRDTSAQRREPLFQQKLQLCSVIFNFDDPQVIYFSMSCLLANECSAPTTLHLFRFDTITYDPPPLPTHNT